MSKYGKVKSFRLDEEDEKLLNECFDTVNIASGSFNAKMVAFIMATHVRLKEIKGLREKVDIQGKKIKEQEKEITVLETQIPSKPVTSTIMEEPSKVEPVTPSKPPSKPVVLKEQPKEDEKPKPGECLRKVRTFQWDVQCKTCRDRHPLDYAKCDAPQKPEALPLKRW